MKRWHIIGVLRVLTPQQSELVSTEATVAAPDAEEALDLVLASARALDPAAIVGRWWSYWTWRDYQIEEIHGNTTKGAAARGTAPRPADVSAAAR